MRGLNLDEFKKNVCHRIFAQDPHIFYQNELITAKNKDFLCAIKDELKDKINDSHFMLWLGDYDFWWKLCEKSFVFYSDLFVEKKRLILSCRKRVAGFKFPWLLRIKGRSEIFRKRGKPVLLSVKGRKCIQNWNFYSVGRKSVRSD